MNEIDQKIGCNIRSRRMEKSISQASLAQKVSELLGGSLTYQQIQKYEAGTNRISASTMWAMGHVLKIPPQYFFWDIGKGLDSDYWEIKLPLNELENAHRLSQLSPEIKQSLNRLVEHILELGGQG